MALTLNNIVGFETGGLEEALSTSGSPAPQETYVRAGDYALGLDQDDQYGIQILASGVDGGSGKYVVGLAYRAASLDQSSFIFAYDSSGQCWKLMSTGGYLFAYDANDSEIASLSNVFSLGDWHYVEIVWEHADSGIFDVHVDGVSKISETGQDLDPGGSIDATAYYNLNNDTSTQFQYDDIYCYSGASGVGDFLGDCEIFRYQANTNSATPDTGDDLDYGDPNALWQEVGTTPADADEIGYAAYPTTGAVYTDDVASGKHYRHGPHGDGNIDGTIKGGKWLHQLRGVGAGDYYKRYGNDGDGLTDEAVVLTTAYVNYMTVSELATVVPLATEHFAIGFKNIDERKDLRCKGMWAFILHVPSVGDITVTPPTATLSTSTFAPSILVPVLATPGTLSLSLATFTPILGLSVIPPPLTLSLMTFAPTVTATANVLVTPGIIALSLTAFAPTVTATANVTVTPGTLSLSLVPFAPIISTPRLVTPPTATLSLAAFAPTVSAPRLVTPAVVNLSITAFAPTVMATGNVLVTPGVLALSLTTFAPTVTATGDVIVIPPPLALSLTEFAPIISTPRLVMPPTLGLTLTRFIPIVTATANVTVIPGIVALILAEFAPTVTATANVTVIPGVLVLSLTTFAPTVTTTGDVTITPGIVALSLTPFAPIIKLVVIAPTLALNLQTFAPTISTPRLATPATATLSLTAFAPTVSAPRLVTPGVLTFSLGLFAPTVSTPRLIMPGLMALSLTTLAPTITVAAVFIAVWLDSDTIALLLVLDGSISLPQAVNDGTISMALVLVLDASVSLPEAVNAGTISIKETEDATV